MANEALGMIETYGYIGAVEAADVCVKSANVKLLGCDFVKGGLVTIHVTGDVGAVKASIDAAESAVKKFGSLISSHVIPRPGEGIEKILPNPKKYDEPKKDYDEDNDSSSEEIETEKTHSDASQEEAGINDNDSKVQVQNEQQETEVESQNSKKEKQKLSVDINSPEELKKIKTVKLRAIARELDDKFSEYFPIERNQIKYSKKNELINAILKFYERVK